MAEDGDDARSLSPLAGVILCCTSIPTEQRSEVAHRVEQMGAVHKLDLTSDVTHLIVGNSNTPKYRYVAKSRPDVVVLALEWVEAIRALWMQGEPIDTQQLAEKYRRPALADLRICLTGFEDVNQRRHLQTMIIQNGAEYSGHLVKEVSHLVASKPDGEKYRHAHMWGLKVVSLEWLVDSVERGMALDETLYDPKLPREERGKNAWTRDVQPTASVGKRSRPEAPVPADAMAGRRKLRRTASTKLQSQNSGIWTDIMGGDLGWKQNATETRPGSPKAETSSTGVISMVKDNVISVGQRALYSKGNGALQETDRDEAVPTLDTENDGLFASRRFYLHGFNEKKTRVLRTHICGHGGTVMSSSSELVAADSELGTYVVAPHDCRENQQKDLPKFTHQPTLVSEWWIERCLHQKIIADPKQHTLSRPFGSFPIPEFHRLTISSSGFSGVDLLHLSKAVQLMGARYDEFLTPKASILICNTAMQNTEKLKHASKWNIPSVKAQWLWDSIKHQERLSYGAYTLPLYPSPINDIARKGPAHTSDNPSVHDQQKDFREVIDMREEVIERSNNSNNNNNCQGETHGTFMTATGSGEKDGCSDNAPDQKRAPVATNSMAELNAVVTALLARKQLAPIAQNISGPESSSVTASNGRKPPVRLGSAPSNLPSTSITSLTRANSVVVDDDDGTAARAPPHPSQLCSQRVLYEDPDVQAHRERVLRKMGASTQRSGPARAQSTRVARDAGGVGTRTRQKTNMVA